MQAVGHDATGAVAGSYLVAQEDAVEARPIFTRVFAGACPVFAEHLKGDDLEFLLAYSAGLVESVRGLNDLRPHPGLAA